MCMKVCCLFFTLLCYQWKNAFLCRIWKNTNSSPVNIVFDVIYLSKVYVTKAAHPMPKAIICVNKSVGMTI
jgi:hypothetical protein